MTFGVLVRNQNQTQIYGDDSKNFAFLGKQRIYMNQWVKPLGLEASTAKLSMFCKNIVGDGYQSLITVPSGGYTGYPVSGRYLGFANTLATPASEVPPAIDYTKYMDVYVFGSYEQVSPPKNGLVLYRADRSVKFHSRTPPLLIHDIVTVNKSMTTVPTSAPVANLVGMVFSFSRTGIYRYVQSSNGVLSVKDVNLNIRLSNNSYYADSYTSPVINTNYYDLFQNVVGA